MSRERVARGSVTRQGRRSRGWWERRASSTRELYLNAVPGRESRGVAKQRAMTTAADSLRRNGTKDGPGRSAADAKSGTVRPPRARRRPPSPSPSFDESKDGRTDGQADTGQDCYRSPGETVSQVFGGRVRDRPGQPDPVVVR